MYVIESCQMERSIRLLILSCLSHNLDIRIYRKNSYSHYEFFVCSIAELVQTNSVLIAYMRTAKSQKSLRICAGSSEGLSVRTLKKGQRFRLGPKEGLSTTRAQV